MSISKWVDKKTVIYLHNGILCSREKEGAYTFWDRMDGTEEYYAKWNKPFSERQTQYGLTYKKNLTHKNELISEIEPETWKHGTDWQWAEGRDKGGKKGKGLVREHVWMIHGHRQQCGDRQWEWRVQGGGE